MVDCFPAGDVPTGKTWPNKVCRITAYASWLSIRDILALLTCRRRLFTFSFPDNLQLHLQIHAVMAQAPLHDVFPEHEHSPSLIGLLCQF